MRKIVFEVFIVLFCFSVIAFEWPQPNNSIVSYFAEKRGESYVNSLVFEQQEEINAADSGKILVHLSGAGSDLGWFDSPLGNAVIIAHDSKLLTVYSNLEEVYLPKDKTEVASLEKIGKSGNSGWQQGLSALEFQIIDSKNKTIVNPLFLMAKKQKKEQLSVHNVIAVNKKGTVFELASKKTLPAGSYLLYRDCIGMPFKTQVSVNGAAVETVMYDTLLQVDNRLCVSGKKKYPLETLYNNKTQQFLSEIVLSRGKNTIYVAVFNFEGEEKHMLFNVDVR